MFLNDGPQSATLSVHPVIDDTTDGRLSRLADEALEIVEDEHNEYIARMKREGLMDEQGVWLPRAIKEATK